ncbi:MAG: glycogen/starch synthase [Bacteroidota bacterium]
MEKKKVLIVTQEMEPYTALSEISAIARKLPQYVQEKGFEIRVLMPRFGTINERRHRLHEVVRLSGMNIIVDDDDFPLIIKVASLPGARLQVYFLDNDDFFKRKSVFEDAKGKPFDDNADRMVFFCKGVLETVKKFGWAPDIIHVHGWMTSLVPLYLKTAYKNEPIFQNSKVVYSLYDNSLEHTFQESFYEKASINNLEPEDLEAFRNGKAVGLHHGAAAFCDAIITGSPELSKDTAKILEKIDKPVLEYKGEEEYLAAYLEFFNTLLEQEVE